VMSFINQNDPEYGASGYGQGLSQNASAYGAGLNNNNSTYNIS